MFTVHPELGIFQYLTVTLFPSLFLAPQPPLLADFAEDSDVAAALENLILKLDYLLSEFPVALLFLNDFLLEYFEVVLEFMLH